jgi:hypothetical protein
VLHGMYGFDHESMASMFIDLWHILDDLDSSTRMEMMVFKVKKGSWHW